MEHITKVNFMAFLKKNKSVIIIGTISFLMFAIMVKNSSHVSSLWLDELWGIGTLRHGQTITGGFKICENLFLGLFWNLF
jgi:hypothetical protein